MSDLRELYQEILLDHYRRPRNTAPLAAASHRAEGHNPLCGDRVALSLEVEDGVVRGVAFDGAGCAISTASASMLTELVKGRTVEEARELCGRLPAVLTEGEGDGGEAELVGELEPLKALCGVRRYPMRVKCATLAWHTLRSALAGETQPISTE